MAIKDLKANSGNVDIVAEVVSKEEPRSFEKFGKKGQVCNAQLADATGKVKMTLWNDEIDTVKVGDKIHLQNGWCSEFKGEKQVSAGKFGKIEIMQGAGQVLTNDPEMLAKASAASDDGEEEEDLNADDLEEYVD
ncbi:hypothetical protein J4437_02215 [Candidatus Woesearchaeota archaeon]|nr:hypothetical protein [Candidatus Woesearchaeota archaeon]